MEKFNFAALSIAILFGVTLIVSGIPLQTVEPTPSDASSDGETSSSNGTHKEL